MANSGDPVGEPLVSLTNAASSCWRAESPELATPLGDKATNGCGGARGRTVRLGEEALQALHTLEQGSVAERIGEAQVAARAECLAWNGGHLGLVEYEVGKLK